MILTKTKGNSRICFHARSIGLIGMATGPSHIAPAVPDTPSESKRLIIDLELLARFTVDNEVFWRVRRLQVNGAVGIRAISGEGNRGRICWCPNYDGLCETYFIRT